MMKPVSILGGAQSDFSKNYSHEAGFLTLLGEVLEKSLAHCNLDYGDVKKLAETNRVAAYVGNFSGQSFLNQGHMGALLTEIDSAFSGVPGARYEAACASGSIALDAAQARIRLGEIDLAIVVGIEVMRTVNALVGNDYLGQAALYHEEAKDMKFAFPRMFGDIAGAIIERNEKNKEGISSERLMQNLRAISLVNRDNASRNPLAQCRADKLSPADLDRLDKKYSKTFGPHMRYSDCSQITDGAAVLLLASDDFASKVNSKQARLKGAGQSTSVMGLQKKIEQNKNHEFMIPQTRQAVERAYTSAGLGVNDIDVFETHDCFTCSEYLAVSAFGITPPGLEYQAVEDEKIYHKGPAPINTSGGLIGAGHPVGASGVRMALDLYRQVTGQAGDYQVAGAKNGAMLNIGGNFTTNMCFVIGQN